MPIHLKRKANPRDLSELASERRSVSRTEVAPWPETQRDDFRRAEFLAGVEVIEGEFDDWGNTSSGLELRRFRRL